MIRPLTVTRADRSSTDALRPLLPEVAALQRRLQALPELADWRSLVAAPADPAGLVRLWEALAALRETEPVATEAKGVDGSFEWLLEAVGPSVSSGGLTALAAAPHGAVLAVAPVGADRPWWVSASPLPEAAVEPDGHGHREGRRFFGVTDVAWSRDGLRLASAQNDDQVRIWAREGWDGGATVTCESAGGSSVGWLTSDIVMSAGAETTTAWDARSGRVVRQWATGGTVVAFPLGGRAAIASFGTSTGVHLVDAASDEVERIAGRFDGLAYGPEGELALVRRGGGGEVHTEGDGWTFTVSPGDGRRRPMAWSPDGTVLAVGSGRRVELVRAGRPNEVVAVPSDVLQLVFTVDPVTLVVGYESGNGWALGFWGPALNPAR